MAIFRLDFKGIFREHAGRDRAAFAAAVATAVRGAQHAGGSIVKQLHRVKIKYKKWGYVIQYASIGQKLLWLLRGAVRRKPRGVLHRRGGNPSIQRARPARYDDEAPAKKLADDLERAGAAQVARYDREKKA